MRVFLFPGSILRAAISGCSAGADAAPCLGAGDTDLFIYFDSSPKHNSRH